MSRVKLYLLAARLREESGHALIEYSQLAVLIAIVTIVLLAAIGLDMQEMLDKVEDALGLGELASDPPVGDDDTVPVIP